MLLGCGIRYSIYFMVIKICEIYAREMHKNEVHLQYCVQISVSLSRNNQQDATLY